MPGQNANAQYRDSVFRDYFNAPERLLSLCNAVLGTDYRDAGKLRINTLEGIFFDNQKNDISCTLENNFLVLIEHQTSVKLTLQWEQDKAIRASYEDGRDDGISEGIEKVALNLLNMGLTVEKIQEATKLSFERIKELAATLKK